MRLSQDLVLRYLTGARDGMDPEAQAQALATVLHESYHSRVEFDAPAEPNAVRKPQSLGLDEGLTELQTAADFDEFAERAGYGGLVLETPEYAGAIEAAGELLSYAATSEAERVLLAASALDAPVMMRWDVVADEIVRTRLGDAVPHDSQHQQAARARLVSAMAVTGWDGVQFRREAGAVVAEDTRASLDHAIRQIREHYQSSPGRPYPSVAPNPTAVSRGVGPNAEQARAITSTGRKEQVDLAKFPPPAASARVGRPLAVQDQPSAADSGRRQDEPVLRGLTGQAPASRAARRPSALGDGARGRWDTQARISSRARTTRQGPTDKGRD
jgi:hypothetical protein